jgi:hypothetical protein
MTQKSGDKKPHELTTEEAMRKLFHPEVVDHAKKHARDAEDRVSKKAMSEQ